jgi:aspartate racemase
MRTVGILGGMGPESTLEYYRLIIARYRERNADGGAPAMLIDSVNLKAVLDLLYAGELARLEDFLVGEVERLARAGADFAAMATNTPHIVFDGLRRRSPIPLISIIEATCEAARALGLSRVGLFGSRFTMQGSFYPEVFSRAGIELVSPRADEQTYIHEKYMGELVNGILRPETRQCLLDIMERMKLQDGIQGLILGGTELPLILREKTAFGIPFLDTTAIHVEAIVTELLA